MTAKAEAVSYGTNILNYISGESKNKKHPDKIQFVCNQYLPASLSPAGIFQSMETDTAMYRGTGHKLSKAIKCTVIKFEISPAAKYTQGWGVDDWKALWEDYAREFDSQTLFDMRGNVKSLPTNIRGSKAAVRVHYDSKSGIPHIHAVVCRVDRDGVINNSHEILQRSQSAAEMVAIRRGWQTAREKGEENKKMLLNKCYGILIRMPRWDWSAYQSAIEAEGFTVNVNEDTTGVVRGYSIKMGNSVYPSSKIHASIKPSQLENTWRKLRAKILEEQAKALAKQQAEAETARRSQERAAKKPQIPATARPQAATSVKPSSQPVVKPQAGKPVARPLPKPKAVEPPYSKLIAPCAEYKFEIGGKTVTRYLPLELNQIFCEGLNSREIENVREIIDTGVALFLHLAVPPMSATGSGGGGSNDQSPWGRDPREDEYAWAKRCAEMARRIVPAHKAAPQKSRGYHR